MAGESKRIKLYHASYRVIEKIDLKQCGKKNDFGQGFYTTTDKAQAIRFVKTAVKKRGRGPAGGFVTMYTIDSFDGLRVYEFPAADTDWLHCVCAHRRFDRPEGGLKKWRSYDVLAGKIANDDTMTVINIYLSGGYGPYGSGTTATMAISLLKLERLKDQLCFKTEAAINRLRFSGFFEVAAP
jgi:hypothetical protein